ncbi:unnamed protein product, partial [Closterium sp. NIES-53]
APPSSPPPSPLLLSFPSPSPLSYPACRAQEQFARFFVREMTEPRNEACIASFARAFWAALRQKRLKGHWVTITPSQKHILPRFGIFFEDFTVWGSVGAWGVLKDRLRAAYGTLDFLKMVSVAVYSALDFLEMVSVAAYGILGFLKMVRAAVFS